MKLNKTQVKIIISLGFILCVLIVAIIYERSVVTETPSVSVDEPTAPSYSEVTPPVYEKHRQARISLEDEISLETNLGGSGNEDLISAFTINGKIYAFASTASSDYDLTDLSCSSFLSVLDRDLHTQGFFAITEQGDTLHKVIPAEGGFLCAYSSNGRIKIKLITYDAQVIGDAYCDTAGKAAFCDLLLLDGKYALVSSPQSTPFGKSKLLVQCFDKNLVLSYERLITSPYSLSFLSLYNIGSDYTVFSKATSDLGSHLAVSVCSAAPEPSTTHIDSESNYIPTSVLPTSFGWTVSAIFTGGEGGVLLLESDFRKRTVLFQSESVQSAFASYCNGLYYYAFFNENGCNLAAYNDSFNAKNTISGFAKVKEIVCTHAGNDYGLFLAREDDNCRIVGTYDTCSIILRTKSVGAAQILRLGDDFFVVQAATEKSGPVGNLFGSTDIWLAKLKV